MPHRTRTHRAHPCRRSARPLTQITAQQELAKFSLALRKTCKAGDSDDEDDRFGHEVHEARVCYPNLVLVPDNATGADTKLMWEAQAGEVIDRLIGGLGEGANRKT